MDAQLEAFSKIAWQMIVVLGGVQVILTGLLSWLGALWLGRTLERERARLARQNEAAAAQLKADFVSMNIEK